MYICILDIAYLLAISLLIDDFMYCYSTNNIMKFFLQTWNYYNTEHKKRFKVLENKISNDTLPHTEDSAYMFDAIWTAALALNATKSQLEIINKTLADFTYENRYKISSVIYEEALKVNFFGLTVSIINNVASV